MSEDATIATLRRLASMTAEQVTVLTGVRPTDVDQRDWKRSLQHFGLTHLRGSKVGPYEGESPSLFLFSGDIASFDVADLTPLALGLDEARGSLVLKSTEEGFTRRAGFRTVRPPASSATDAAHQGYYLAQQVRTVLEEPLAPLLDISDRAEQRLGVCVRSARFSTRSLRAAAVRDAGMGAAAILVNTDTRDPRLVRVAIAHELCHLLFDPSGLRVVLTLDQLPQGPTGERAENRARAFAAELLVPRAGLKDLLGHPDSVSKIDGAVTIVDVAQQYFGVSRELAIWHLANHKFIAMSARDALLRSLKRSRRFGAHGLKAVVPSAENVHRARKSREKVATRHKRLEQIACESARSVLSSKLAEAKETPLDVAVALGRVFDDALESGQHTLGLALLTQLDPRLMPGDTSSGFLGYVKAPCLALGGEWRASYMSAATKTVDALAKVWHWETEDLADAATGLLG